MLPLMVSRITKLNTNSKHTWINSTFIYGPMFNQPHKNACLSLWGFCNINKIYSRPTTIAQNPHSHTHTSSRAPQTNICQMNKHSRSNPFFHSALESRRYIYRRKTGRNAACQSQQQRQCVARRHLVRHPQHSPRRPPLDTPQSAAAVPGNWRRRVRLPSGVASKQPSSTPPPPSSCPQIRPQNPIQMWAGRGGRGDGAVDRLFVCVYIYSSNCIFTFCSRCAELEINIYHKNHERTQTAAQSTAPASFMCTAIPHNVLV